MAAAVQSRGEPAPEAVQILNKAQGTSTASPKKKKRKSPSEIARRPVGRPAKRNRLEDDANTRPEAARLESRLETETISKKAAQLSTTPIKNRLRNSKPSGATKQPQSAAQRARDNDMSALQPSPQSASQATKTRASRGTNNFDLQHSVFAPVPSTHEGKGELAKRPAQNTRSKAEKNTGVEQRPHASKLSGGTRTMRILRPRSAVPDSIDKDSPHALDERAQPSRTMRPQPNKLQRPAARTDEHTIADSEQLGYPSPARRSRANDPHVEQAEAPSEENEVSVGEGADQIAGSYSEGQTSENHSEDEPQSIDDRVVEALESQRRGTISMGSSQSSNTSQRTGSFVKAAELYGCSGYWSRACDAARKVRHSGDPETKQVRKVVNAIRDFKSDLERTVNGPGQPVLDQDILYELQETDLDKIANAIGNLKPNPSRGTQRENAMLRDVYLHAVPWAVDLLRSMLLVRFSNGALSVAALEELVMVLKATRRLCERLYHWKSSLHLGDRVKSTTNLDIKLSLESIEKEYEDALSELRAANQDEEAKIREAWFAAKQSRLNREREDDMLAKRQKLADWARKVGRDRQMWKHKRTESRMQVAASREASPTYYEDEYDIDDLDLHGLTPQATTGYVRERVPVEDIPGPTGRIWKREETVALLLLLQKYRGSDRYENIQKAIKDIARDVRKIGVDKVLQMTDSVQLNTDLGDVRDVLDNLGMMDVEEIKQKAEHLRESHAEIMERDIRATGDTERWRWLLSL